MDEQTEPVRGLTKDEQETQVVRSRTAEWTIIESTIPTDITVLRKHPRVEEIESGFFGTTAWARFRVPSDQWNPARGVKKAVNMTTEQRNAARERMRALHA